MTIASFWTWCEAIFFSSKKRFLGTVIVGILLLSMPVTLMLLNQRQDIRQRAADITSCLATTVQSYNVDQNLCNTGVGSYTMTVTCGDGYQATKQYLCGINNSKMYESDATAICAARSNLCAPTPRPTSPLPAPKQISCPKPVLPGSTVAAETNPTSVEITFDMKAPIYAVTDGPITSVEYVRGNWCAWAGGNDDPASGGKCPVLCPHAPNSLYPFSIAEDKMSFYSDFDYPYLDNTGSCTYAVACTASDTVSPTPSSSPSPVISPIVSPSPVPNPSIIPLPSISPTPITPSTVPGTTVTLTLALPGIGTDTLIGENNAPKHPTRTFSVYAFDNNAKQAAKITTNFIYNAGVYTGTADFGNIPAGPYTIKVQADNSLIKTIPGIYNLSDQNTAVTPKITLVTGDIKTDGNSNNLLDLDDYNSFLSLFGKIISSVSQSPDLNDDGVINSKDLNILLRGYATRRGD